jgi:hypothetical protein
MLRVVPIITVKGRARVARCRHGQHPCKHPTGCHPGIPASRNAHLRAGHASEAAATLKTNQGVDHPLTTPVPGIGAQWPRACALLIRLALEMTLDRFWARVLPAAASCGMRQQLLLLPLYIADLPTASGLAREAWLGLAGGASPRL